MLPELLFSDTWLNCNQDIKQLVEDELFMKNCNEIPKAVLLFEYTMDLDLIEEEYLKQNPEVNKVILGYVKFLPKNLLYLIENKKLFSKNMFPLLIAF